MGRIHSTDFDFIFIALMPNIRLRLVKPESGVPDIRRTQMEGLEGRIFDLPFTVGMSTKGNELCILSFVVNHL